MSEKDPHRYDDIISLPRFVSKGRRHMSNYDRAAQFAPFDALTGYDEAIEETGRTTEEEILLGESENRALDMKFQILREHIDERPEVILTFFVPDLYKEGGSYKEEKIAVKRIDMNERALFSTDKKRYDLDYIVSVRSALFNDLDL
ncbi:MAG: hypothetical protein IIZ28_04530 [Erysipelotrichaceae bacterium]|nr:hypothetical protein [Erysipelotrichaceae bacterium]